MSPWPGSASVDVCRRGAKVDTTSMGAWSRSSRSTQYPLVTASVRTPGRHTNWPGTSVHWYVPSRAYNTKGRSQTEQIWPWKQQQWVERKKAGTQNTLTCHIPGFVLKSPFKIHELFTDLCLRPLLFISLSHSDNQSETANFYNSSKVDVGGNVLTLTLCLLRSDRTESFWMPTDLVIFHVHSLCVLRKKLQHLAGHCCYFLYIFSSPGEPGGDGGWGGGGEGGYHGSACLALLVSSPMQASYARALFSMHGFTE